MVVIKLPRDKVEIFEVVGDTEDEIDVENVSDTDMNNVNLHQLEIKQENKASMKPIKQEIVYPDTDCTGQMSNNVHIKIEHHSIDINDIKEEPPSIDDIVMDNLNQTGLEYEDEDGNEHEDASWEPWDKKSESDEDSNADAMRDLDEDEWKPVSRSKTKNKRRIESIIPQIKKQENEKSLEEKHEHQCELCDASYTYHPALVRHVNAYHNNKYQCSECKLKFLSSLLLRKHMLTVHSQLFLMCPVCKDGSSTSLEDINTHIVQAHSQSAHLCPNSECRRIYTSELYLKTHLRACKGEKGAILKCDTCDKVFAKKYTMEKHLEVHMGVIHKCSQCEKTFSHQRSLYRHKDLEHSGKIYKCDPCCRIFADDRGLAKHKKLVHKEKGGMPEKYLCTLCPNKYWQKITLLRHIKNAHYSCDTCNDKDPSTKVNACRHYQLKCLKKYNYNKCKYTCNICKLVYSCKRDVRNHIQAIHHETTYYTCPLCEQTLKRVDYIRKHKQAHELHQFQCNHCTKVFAHRKTLIKHLRQVAGVLSEPGTVDNVLSTVDTNYKYSCPHCFLSFTKKTDLRFHVQCCIILRNNSQSQDPSMKFSQDCSSVPSCQVKTEEMVDLGDTCILGD